MTEQPRAMRAKLAEMLLLLLLLLATVGPWLPASRAHWGHSLRRRRAVVGHQWASPIDRSLLLEHSATRQKQKLCLFSFPTSLARTPLGA